MKKITSLLLCVIMLLGITPITSNAVSTSGMFPNFPQLGNDIVPNSELLPDLMFIPGGENPHLSSKYLIVKNIYDDGVWLNSSVSYYYFPESTGILNSVISNNLINLPSNIGIVERYQNISKPVTEEKAKDFVTRTRAGSMDTLLHLPGYVYANEINSRIIGTTVPITLDGITYEPFMGEPKPTAKNTITINANIDPYLEVNLDKTQLDFNLTTLEDSTQSINTNVKSNMNYKIEAKFNGLNNADSSSSIGVDTFKLLSNGVNKDLTLGAYSILEDNKVLGDTNHPLSLKIENSKIIKSDTYTGTLELKVSQL